MVTERSLRESLHAAPVPGADAGLAERALASGRAATTRRRRRRAVSSAVAGVAVVAAVAAYGVVTTPAPPTVAALSCDGHGVHLARSTVDAGETGARLHVTNATADVVPLVVGDVAALVPPGRSAVDVPLRPGRVTVSCGAGAAALTVTDTGDRWRRDDVGCASPRVQDLRATSEPAYGDPVALTRAALDPPRGATVEPAGYPGAPDLRTVRVVHGDVVVAVARWRSLPANGAWTLDEVRRCAPLAYA